MKLFWRIFWALVLVFGLAWVSLVITEYTFTVKTVATYLLLIGWQASEIVKLSTTLTGKGKTIISWMAGILLAIAGALFLFQFTGYLSPTPTLMETVFAATIIVSRLIALFDIPHQRKVVEEMIAKRVKEHTSA